MKEKKFRSQIKEGQFYGLILNPATAESNPTDLHTKAFSQLISQVKQLKISCLFIQPHFDDNVLSAGGLMKSLAMEKVPIKSITVMSDSSEEPVNSSLALGLLNEAGQSNQKEYFAKRNEEDNNAMRVIGISERINLHQVDLPWRTDADGKPLYLGIRRQRALEDEKLKLTVTNQLSSLVNKQDLNFVFVPVGVAKHTDHILVRDAAISAFQDSENVMMVFYEDIPYAMTLKYLHEPEILTFISTQNLGRVSFYEAQNERIEAIYQYVSQLRSGLFKKFQTVSGSEEVNLPGEGFYINSDNAFKFLRKV